MAPATQWPPGFQDSETRSRWLNAGREDEKVGRGGGGNLENEGEFSSLRRKRETLEGKRRGGGD